MRRESSGKPDAWKLARPVWGWGRGETPRPTPRDGLVIWAKRLERGGFQVPSGGDAASLCVEIDSVTLAMMIGGVDLGTAKRRKRYRAAAG
jgi:hypothetical protein